MADTKQRKAGDLFIVDNSEKAWKALRYLHDWADLAHTFDIATGYFEIGALLGLDGQWQKLDKIRVLMGDTVSRRTKKALLAGVTKAVKEKLDDSLEAEKENNDFLVGVPGIVDAMRNRQIECRIYTKKKFHAKAYITHAKHAVMGSAALVGSSNFTVPGLTENVELNIQLRREVEALQEWFEAHWNEAEDVSGEVLNVIERHTREYMPFEVYAKAMQEFFRGHEMTAGEWEQTESKMYPVLDQYQKEGYQAMMKIARQYGGAFLCDGVGLGKTFVGLMLIERLVMFDRQRVALFVPKAAREDVWERDLRRYLRHLRGDFSNLAVFNHTDLLRGGEYQYRLDRVKEMADAIVIDEAHHFRNRGLKDKSRYWRLHDIAEGKRIFMLTATPVNNRLTDLQHMMELFTQGKPDHFKAAPLGIHSLPGHFRTMEKALERLIEGRDGIASDDYLETNQAEAEQVLFSDALFRAIVVQRTRGYVKQSQKQHGGNTVTFPRREDPKVTHYSIKKTYGHLLDMIEEGFSKEKPLFSLAIYNPYAYYKGADEQIDPMVAGRQRQVVRLIRTGFLKRFESSASAFEMSCGTLLRKLLAWVEVHAQTENEKRLLERWRRQHADLIGYVHHRQGELFGGESEEEADEDIITDEMREAVKEVSRDEFKVDEILAETILDLDQVADFLEELKKFKSAHDHKLKALVKLLKTDPVLKTHKVIIFTEFMATARYLKKELQNAGFADLDEVDSAVKRSRSDIIRAFAPYYNRPPQGGLFEGMEDETRILISTDVLSEGLNLQDATRVINYDLHWNPVRLMQRIGRVDRRLSAEIEAQIIADHPDQKAIRGTGAYWNFLPPEELDDLLRLYAKVSHKVLRISKVFGIQGRKLLTPEDDYDALRDFTHTYEGTTTPAEEMHLEYQRLLKDYPDLEERLNALPGRVFSGKEHPSPDARGVFFCYALPAPEVQDRGREDQEPGRWTEEAGYTKWYLYDLTDGKILDEPSEIIGLIRCTPDTPRRCLIEQETLSEIRAKIDKHIKKTYLKHVNAPQGVNPVLKAWMELN